jgi:hypothetical protein
MRYQYDVQRSLRSCDKHSLVDAAVIEDAVEQIVFTVLDAPAVGASVVRTLEREIQKFDTNDRTAVRLRAGRQLSALKLQIRVGVETLFSMGHVPAVQEEAKRTLRQLEGETENLKRKISELDAEPTRWRNALANAQAALQTATPVRSLYEQSTLEQKQTFLRGVLDSVLVNFASCTIDVRLRPFASPQGLRLGSTNGLIASGVDNA